MIYLLILALSFTACGGGAVRPPAPFPTPPLPAPVVSEPVVIEPVEPLPPPALPPVDVQTISDAVWLDYHRPQVPDVRVYHAADGASYFTGGLDEAANPSEIPKCYAQAKADILSVRPDAEIPDLRPERAVVFREANCNGGRGFLVPDGRCATGNTPPFGKIIEIVAGKEFVLCHEYRHLQWSRTPGLQREQCPDRPSKLVWMCVGDAGNPSEPECKVCDPLRGR
jgi:hypothetical protein